MDTFILGSMYWNNPKYGLDEFRRDMRAIRDHHFNFIRTFILWEHVERKKGVFDFGNHPLLFQAAAEYGIRVMPTLLYYLPFELACEEYDAGIWDDPNDRRYPCLDREPTRSRAERYIRATVERFKNEPALWGWNLWNEPTDPPAKCPETLALFASWLKQKYPTYEDLRNGWLGEYAIFDTLFPNSMEKLTADWLAKAFTIGKRGRTTPIDIDFIEFGIDNATRHVQWIADIVKGIDPIHPTHVNSCSPTYNGLFCGVDEWELATCVDTLGVSFHPFSMATSMDARENHNTVFAFTAEGIRSQADGKPGWIGEIQAGSTYLAQTFYTLTPHEIRNYILQSIGRGLGGFVFWEWQSWRTSIKEPGEFSLVNASDGAPTERSLAAAEVGLFLEQNQSRLASMRPQPAQVAIFSSRYTAQWNLLQSRDHLTDVKATQYACFKAFHNANIKVDFITERQLDGDFLSRYKLVVLPQVEVMDGHTAECLADYVQKGGALWADGRCAWLDTPAFLRHSVPGHCLAEVFGCTEGDYVAPTCEIPSIQLPETTLQGYQMLQYLRPTTGNAIGFFGDKAVVVRNRYGKGVAELCGTRLSFGLFRHWDAPTAAYLVDFAKNVGVRSVATLPDGIYASRLMGPEEDLLVVSNSTAAPISFEVEGISCTLAANETKPVFTAHS